LPSLQIMLLPFLLLCAATAQFQLNYNIGDDFQFNFASQINHAAQPVGGAASQSSLSSMTGVMEMEVQDWDGQLYYFVMNLFDVDVEANNGAAKATRINDGDDGLGADMYFSMTPQGQIPTIWYQEGDSPFFINIKASAISALQTHLVPANKNAVFSEQDLIGTHTTQFAGLTSSSGLMISKTFTQSNVIQFADKHITKATFNLLGQSNVSIHPQGYITGAFTEQTVKFVSAIDGLFQNSKIKADPALGFDSNLMSFGNLRLLLASTIASGRLSTPEAVVNKVQTNFMEIGSMASVSPLNTPKMKTAQQFLQALQTPKKTDYNQLRAFVRLFKQNPDLVTVFSSINENIHTQKVALSRWLYILGLVDSAQSNAVLREMLHNDNIRGEVIRSLITSRVTDCSLLTLLPSFMDKSFPERDHTVIAFGSLIRRCSSNQHKLKAKTVLSNVAKAAQQQSDKPMLYAVKAASENAGYSLPTLFEQDPSFPYSKSFDKAIEVGGSMLNAQFGLDLFIGTNFDCNHKTFNYAAWAIANATVNFLGDSKDAFLGKAIYGKENGQNLANQLYLRVWDDVIYNSPIPTLDCNQHTYPIGSYQSPGLDVTYTIWVSIIPVTFTAGVDAEMSLEWAWQICDTDLSATVELIPDGKLVATAGALSDLLVIEGGININADFELIPEPQAFIHGSLCEVGFDVEVSYDPMEASVDVWWRENVCEWWIFDCHWGPYHTDNLWSWNAAERHVVLLKETWKIAP